MISGLKPYVVMGMEKRAETRYKYKTSRFPFIPSAYKLDKCTLVYEIF